MIKSLKKALNILTLLSKNQGKSVSLKTMSEELGVNKSTCAHLVKTLEEEGYVTKISASKGYVLGPAAYCLSEGGRYKKDLVAICRPVIDYLYKSLGHCVALSILENGKKYIIDYIDDGTIFKEKKAIMRDDIYRTATGRVLLMNLPDEDIVEIYEKFGAPAEGDWDEVKSADDIIRIKRNIAVGSVVETRKVYEKVALGYALPIFDLTGCVGAVGVAVYISLEEEKKFAEEEKIIKSFLKKGANEIMRRLKN